MAVPQFADAVEPNVGVPQQNINPEPPQATAQPLPKKTRGDIPEKLRGFIKSKNIAEDLSDIDLEKIGAIVCQSTEEDEESRQPWMDRIDKSMKIAKQVIEEKTTPWDGAASVKYPLLLNASMQFNARTNPEVTQGDKVVYVNVSNPNPNEELEDRALRLSAHMSYQLLEMNDHWRTDTDKLLMVLPMIGTVFRKSYFNELKGIPDSDLCLPNDIILHSNVASIESARRITHRLWFSNNDLVERMRLKMFTEIPLVDLINDTTKDNEGGLTEDVQLENAEVFSTDKKSDITDDVIHEIYEQHCYQDLDGDGYAEPYIVTVHVATQKVLRIVPRYNLDSFDFEKGIKEFIRINPIQYFTDYHFIPAPDGTFYSMGFGWMLYPINESINTVLNQLLDAGNLANIGALSGFVGKSLRMRKGEMKVKLGKFTTINAPNGVDISRNIVPLPVREPSNVLFQLLGMLVDAGKEMASMVDVLQGNLPPANTPATTVLSMIEQGMKVFSAIQHRIFNASKKEYKKLYELNKTYLPTQGQYYKNSIASGMILPSDYESDDFGINPVANPNQSTSAQRLAQANALMQLIGHPGVNTQEILKRWLEAVRIENPEKILPPPDPNAPPSPQEQLANAELEFKHSEGELNKMRANEILMQKELDAMRLELDSKKVQIEAEQVSSDVARAHVNTMVEVDQALVDKGDAEIRRVAAMSDLINQSDPASQNIQQQNEVFGQRIDRLEQMMGSFGGSPAPNAQSPQNAQPSQTPSVNPQESASTEQETQT